MDTQETPITERKLTILRPLQPNLTNLPDFKPYYHYAPFSYICVTIYTFKDHNRDARNLDVQKFLLMPETDKFAITDIPLTSNTYFAVIGYSLPQNLECPTARVIWVYDNNETLIDCNDQSKMPLSFTQNYCDLILLPKKHGNQNPKKLYVFHCKPENLVEIFDHQNCDHFPDMSPTQNNLLPTINSITFNQSILQGLKYIYNGGRTHKKAYLELIKLGYATKTAPTDLTPATAPLDTKRFKTMQNKAKNIIIKHSVQNLHQIELQQTICLDNNRADKDWNQIYEDLNLWNQTTRLYNKLYNNKKIFFGLIFVMLSSSTNFALLYFTAITTTYIVSKLIAVITFIRMGYLSFKFISNKFEPFRGGRDMVANKATIEKKNAEEAIMTT